jgi:hypothetical protein
LKESPWNRGPNPGILFWDMTTRHDAPKPIGPARAHELDLAIGYAGGCSYCRGLGRDDFAHDDQACPAQARHVAMPADARARELELELTARELVTAEQRRAMRRIHEALTRDAREHLRQLLGTRANWLPWQPIEQGRYRRAVALRRLAIDLARLVVALGVVWLAFAVRANMASIGTTPT